jgi:hypothetical protein
MAGGGIFPSAYFRQTTKGTGGRCGRRHTGNGSQVAQPQAAQVWQI